MRRSLSHPSVAPIDLTHTLLDFPISGARHHPSAGRICRLHTLRLMATRQSIIPATAPSAPAFAANVEVEPVASTIPVVPLTRLGQYTFTTTSSLALSARASQQMKPRQLHCAHLFQSTANRKVAAVVWHRLAFQNLRVKIARVLFRTLNCGLLL